MNCIFCIHFFIHLLVFCSFFSFMYSYILQEKAGSKKPAAGGKKQGSVNKKADAKPAGNKKTSTLKKTQPQDENCDYSDLRDAIDGELYFSLNSLLPVLLTKFCIYCYLKEKSLRHVAMVKNRNWHHLKSEFALFQTLTSTILFKFI